MSVTADILVIVPAVLGSTVIGAVINAVSQSAGAQRAEQQAQREWARDLPSLISEEEALFPRAMLLTVAVSAGLALAGLAKMLLRYGRRRLTSPRGVHRSVGRKRGSMARHARQADSL